jgi:hypothetical protein
MPVDPKVSEPSVEPTTDAGCGAWEDPNLAAEFAINYLW